MIDFSLGIDRKKPHKFSEILLTLLGCRQELRLDMMRRRWPFSLKCQLEITDDPVDRLRFFEERDDSHPAATSGTIKRIHLEDLADHLGPALGGHISRIIINDGRKGDCRNSFDYLAPVGNRL
jgi:hypothetical protein